MRWTDVIAGIAYIFIGAYLGIGILVSLGLSVVGGPGTGAAVFLALTALSYVVAGVLLLVRSRSQNVSKTAHRLTVFVPWILLIAYIAGGNLF